MVAKGGFAKNWSSVFWLVQISFCSSCASASNIFSCIILLMEWRIKRWAKMEGNKQRLNGTVGRAATSESWHPRFESHGLFSHWCWTLLSNWAVLPRAVLRPRVVEYCATDLMDLGSSPAKGMVVVTRQVDDVDPWNIFVFGCHDRIDKAMH